MDGGERGKVDKHNSGGVASLWRIQRLEDERAIRVELSQLRQNHDGRQNQR